MLRYLAPVLLALAAYICFPKYIQNIHITPKISIIRGGNHHLVLLQLTTPDLLPEQLDQLDGDVR